MVVLCWSHRCKNSTNVKTKWFTVTKYSFFKWLWIISAFRRFCLPFIIDTSVTELDQVSNPVDILPFASLGSPLVLVGSVLFIILVFCVVFLFCLCSFCVLCHMLTVSLDCSIFIAPSVFSSVYLLSWACPKIELNIIPSRWSYYVIQYDLFIHFTINRDEKSCLFANEYDTNTFYYA